MEFFRGNDGADFMAVPPQAPGETSEAEAIMLEAKNKKIEALEAKIAEIGNNQTHPAFLQLTELKEELAKLRTE